MADIFQQVDESLREERLKGLWRRYGWMLILGVVLIVGGTAAIVGWRAYEQSEAEDQTDAYLTVLAEAGDDGAAVAEALIAFAEERDGGIAALAQMHAAGLTAQAGDTAGAVRQYDLVADNTDLPKSIRDAARIMAALHAFDLETSAEVRSRIIGLEDPASPWRHSAREILAMLALRDGDADTAISELTAIIEDVDAPRNIRVRANELLQALAPPEEAEEPAEDEADAPAEDAADAPAEDAADAPAEDAADTPAEDAADAPAEDAADAPAEDAADAPAEDAADTPAEDAADAPAEDAADTPAEDAADTPAEDAADAPAEDAADAPAEDAADAPAEDAADTPAEDAADTPAEDAADAPAEDAADTPAENAADTPAEDAADAPEEDVVEGEGAQ